MGKGLLWPKVSTQEHRVPLPEITIINSRGSNTGQPPAQRKMKISLAGISAYVRGRALLRGEMTVLTLKSRLREARDEGFCFSLN